MVGGNIVGGNPVEVTRMKVASLLSSGRDDQSGASEPTSVTPWGGAICCVVARGRIG